LRFLVCLLLAAACSSASTRGADPLADQVTIYRDTFGTPHIVGDSEEGAFFGYGYAQAEDHLEDMMIQYRDAQGRRAEVQGINALGAGYLHFIPYEYRWDGDYLQRLLKTKATVAANRKKIEPDVYKILDAFARGVNAYIAAHRSAIPSWIDSVTAEDVEALERSHYMRFYSIHDALMKMTGKVYDFPGFGSNQWAIAPGRSADGRIIHVEHTHMPWANRFQNYEAHLIVPGKLSAGGISWFGSPVFLDGFNDRITWSATWNTPNMADDRQLREMTCDPKFRKVLVTDAKTALGQALVDAVVAAGADLVWAGCAEPWKKSPGFERLASIPQVSLLTLDLTDSRAVRDIAGEIGGRVDILINTADYHRNFGIAARNGIEVARAEMDMNYFGLLRLAQEFAPAMRARAADGQSSAVAWVNLLSIFALSSFPPHGTYSASKAAALSLAQCLRAELGSAGVRVINVFPGPIDDEWNQALLPPKIAPGRLAVAIIDALRSGAEDVYPGEVAEDWLARWRDNPKALERELASASR